jgi:hypothetical protein
MTTPAWLHFWWYGAMAAGGLAFGLMGERRPFGRDVLGHPLVVFFVLAAAALLVMRIWDAPGAGCDSRTCADHRLRLRRRRLSRWKLGRGAPAGGAVSVTT